MATAEGFRSAGNTNNEDQQDGGGISGGADVDFDLVEVEAGETAVQQAWGELADIEREQERWSELRTHIEQKLEVCRQRGVSLEDVSNTRPP